MPEKLGYRVYDTVQGLYLASFRKPVKGCDVAVTRWTEDPEGAMAFRVLAVALPVFGVLFAVIAKVLRIGRGEDDV